MIRVSISLKSVFAALIIICFIALIGIIPFKRVPSFLNLAIQSPDHQDSKVFHAEKSPQHTTRSNLEALADQPACSRLQEGVCEHWVPDWLRRTDIQGLLEERIQKIRNRCNTFKAGLFNISGRGTAHNPKIGYSTMRARIMTNRGLKLSLCTMHKVASTFWKHAWERMARAFNQNLSAATTRPQSGWMTVSGLWRMQSSLPPESKHIIFTITRNPWHRLVSAYIDKVLTQTNHASLINLGPGCKIMETFEKYLRCVVKQMLQKQQNSHIETSYSHCGVCDYPYDIVVLFENMNQEVQNIFKRVGIINPDLVMQQARNASIRVHEAKGLSKSYQTYYEGIPKELLDQVRRVYRYELELYDYPKTPFIDSNYG